MVMAGTSPAMTRSKGLELQSAADSNFKQPGGHASAFPRRGSRPSDATTTSLAEERAQGNAGCPTHPQLACDEAWHTSKSPQLRRNDPALSARWLDGLFRALPGDQALLSPSPEDDSTDLTSALGRQNHAASPTQGKSHVLRRHSRPSHPASYVRDDREAPLVEAERRKCAVDLGLSTMPRACGRLARRAICA